MGYLIDTNIIIYSLKNHSLVNRNFELQKHIPKAISVITYGELYFGARKSQFKEKNTATVQRIAELFPIIQVNKAIMSVFGELKANLQTQGVCIDDFDLIIAATSLVMNYTLVTNNVSHFSPIPSLKLENWAKE
jgi:tRNA(fMet)-specific endonuclease VapC